MSKQLHEDLYDDDDPYDPQFEEKDNEEAQMQYLAKKLEADALDRRENPDKFEHESRDPNEEVDDEAKLREFDMYADMFDECLNVENNII